MLERLSNLALYLELDITENEIAKIPLLCKSSTAERMNIDNSLPDELLQNALITSKLCDWLLSHKYAINSVYRCPALNVAVGGVLKSRHLECRAIDIQLTYKDDVAIVQYIINEFNNILYPVAEVNYHYRKGNMLHVDWRYK